MQAYNKAIGSILGGIVSLAALLGLDITSIGDTEAMIGAVSLILAQVLAVYFAPKNKEE